MKAIKRLGLVSASVIAAVMVACGGPLPTNGQRPPKQPDAERKVDPVGIDIDEPDPTIEVALGVDLEEESKPADQPARQAEPREPEEIRIGKVYYFKNGTGETSYLPILRSTVGEMISAVENDAPQVTTNLIRIGLIKPVSTWSRVEVQDWYFDGTYKVLLLDGQFAASNGYVLGSWLVSSEQRARMEAAEAKAKIDAEIARQARIEQDYQERKARKEQADAEKRERKEAERLASINAEIEPRVIAGKPVPIIAAKSPTHYKQYLLLLGKGERARADKMVSEAEVFLFVEATKLITYSTVSGYVYARPYDGPLKDSAMVFAESDVKKLPGK